MNRMNPLDYRGGAGTSRGCMPGFGAGIWLMVYRVNEIFAGLEGEGHNPGTPTVRVRLQGCAQACKLRKVCDQESALALESGTAMALAAIVDAVVACDAGLPYPYPWVSLSGGEPLEQA